MTEGVNWPECMAPDGAEPCPSFTLQLEQIAKLELDARANAVRIAELEARLRRTFSLVTDVRARLKRLSESVEE